MSDNKDMHYFFLIPAGLLEQGVGGHWPPVFGRSLWLWHIWSQAHMVPGHLVPQNWSPIDWSLWGKSPQPIQSLWTNGPKKFDSSGQMVPKIIHLSRGTGCRDLEIGGLNLLGTIWSEGPNFLGPFVHGDQIWWGPSVQRDQFYGAGSGVIEIQGSNGFGTKCVTASLNPYLNQGVSYAHHITGWPPFPLDFQTFLRPCF